MRNRRSAEVGSKVDNASKLRPFVLPMAFIAAFTAILASFVPSVVLAARDSNTFILSIAIPGMLVVLVLDGVALALLRKGQNRDSKPQAQRTASTLGQSD